MKYDIVKRIFLAQPRKNEYQHSTWIARPIENMNVSDGGYLPIPTGRGSFSHEPFEIYYHQSIVDELKNEIKKLKEETS